MDTIDRMMDVVVDHLGAVATSGAVSGKPIEVGEVTLVVLSSLSVGMGAAGGHGSAEAKDAKKAQPGGGAGEGAGGGAKVRPAAVIAFTPTGVEVLTIPSQPGVIDKVVERVPQVVEMVEKARHAFD